MKYRFVGTLCEIGDRRLAKLGDEITLTPEQAAHHIAGGARLLADHLFAKTFNLEQEVSLFATPGQRINAPETFHAKIAAAWGLVDTPANLAPPEPVAQPKESK